MAYALGLPDALRRRGLTVEVVPGWETRSAGSFNPKGAVCHWTAGPANATGRPSLNICVHGRADLPGPLCNVYLDRNGVAVVVAAGRANHAGTGGWKGLAGNSAVFGTEAEARSAADFTAAQRRAYPRVNAAYCDLGGFGADMVCGHSEWAGPRKTDINGYTMADMRREVAAILAGAPVTSEEDDMPYTPQQIRDFVWQGPIDSPSLGKRVGAWEVLRAVDANAAVAAKQSASLSAAVTALTKLVAEQNGLTVDDVRAAVREEVAKGVDVTVSVNDRPA